MNFASFWETARKKFSGKREMYTLKRKKQFSAQCNSLQIMVIPKSTKYKRNISQKQFLSVWEQAKKYNSGEQFRPKNYGDITRHSSYIVTIMKYILKDEKIE